jgi:hypothetical protein
MCDSKKRPLFANEYSGEILEAFLIAYNDFRGFLIKTRNLKNYTVILRETDVEFEVSFLPKLSRGQAGVKGGLIGESIKYHVLKQTFKINKKTFAR